MYKIKQSLTAFAGLSLLIGLIATVTPSPTQGQGNSGSAPPPFDVNVINTPLPVTGTINVGNLGDSPLPVRDVDNPARQPLTFAKSGDFGNGCCTSVSFTVPEGKRLVVEQVSVEFTLKLSATQNASCLVRTTAANVETAYHVAGINVGTFGGFTPSQSFVASSQMRSYADPGTQVVIAVQHPELGAPDRFTANLSGYLVDVP